MRDYQKELEALRERLARRQEDANVLSRLLQQEQDLQNTVERRLTEWDREHRDVERMERVSLSSVWASLRGTREEDLLRERAEEQAALLKLQEAERQLEEVQAEIAERQNRLRESADCQRKYEALLREKEQEYRAKDPAFAAKLAELERRELELTARRRELLEAVEAGKRALEHISGALNSLSSAEGWSTWDLLGGGLVSDMIKYSHMDEAQACMEYAQSALRRYQAELADVAMTASFDLQPGGMTYAMDLFFDNIFTDWAVRDHIQQSLGQMEYVENRVGQLQARLELDLDETERALSALRAQRQETIRQA